jgi:hypothetical protein
MARADSLFGSFAARADRLRQRAAQARRSAKNVAREVGRSVGRAREEAEHTARALGMPMDQGQVIDLGRRPSALKQLGTAVAATLLALLVGGSLVAFTSFFLQFLIATVIATRVLGINLDINPSAARA